MQADGDGGFEGGCFMLDRVGGCYSTLFVVMWSDRRVATLTEEPLKWGGWFCFSREQRAREWGGADVLRWKPIQLLRKGLRTTDDGKNGHGRPSDTYIKSNQTTLGDRPRGRLSAELWTAHVAPCGSKLNYQYVYLLVF